MLETLNQILFWILILLLVHEAYTLVRHRGIPNICTAPAIRREMIDIIRNAMATQGKDCYTIVDLGSGNGLFSREIARALPEATVIGVEIAGESVLQARWKAKRAGLKNLSYEKTDFMKFDFARADAVVMYLHPTMMERLGQKLHTEARQGTLILSNKFGLGDGWTPDETHRVPSTFLHQKDFFVYRA
jgi:SAM-dependent methyltransferase